MWFFTRLVVGFLVSAPFTAFFSGGMQNAVQLLAISIVCTAGIGLAFWIPVWLVVGMFTIDVVGRRLSGKPKRKPVAKANPTELPSRDYTALKAYIANAVTRGMDVDEMKRRLEQTGWKKSDIEAVYQSFVAYMSTPQKP